MNPIKKFYSYLVNLKNGIEEIRKYNSSDYKSPKVMLGKLISKTNSSIQPKKLEEIEFQVFSQFGDDGIIQWLINKLPIPNKTFIEFGVENYRESNTRFLLINNYWSGFVIDGDLENVKTIKNDQIYHFYDIQAECLFIKKSNINEVMSLPNFDPEVGILSIDIDGNDYWIWEEITQIQPVIVICEYNSLFGFEAPYTIQYEDDFVRGHKYPFNFYGTSLRSIYNLAIKKGYKFIGSNSAGNNAYFIKDKYFDYLSIPEKKPEEGYIFASFSECWDNNKNPLKGIAKIKSIDSLPVFNTDTKAIEAFDAESVIQSLIQFNKTNRF
jgi:hypothetical protein